MSAGMNIFAARLATFDTVLHVSKGRTSGVKTGKSIGWPHSKPSPAELAHAGFYYNPYETNPDNTTCFLCRRALDGWEEDDSPIAEHLKHSSDCGWAIMMDVQQQSSNPSEIEDPTSAKIVEARKATFGPTWPHDGKQGWVCQSDKMVEAGWYFCPNDESPDLASCAYCKLSLDGWEPKDDPMEEHYRRSSDCSFFVFAQVPGQGKKKSTRSKKPRVSKASRLSSQSTMTATSEAMTLDHDDTMDMSHLSQSAVKTAKSTKRATRSKAKSSKGKKDDPTETSSHADAEDAAESQTHVSVKPTRATRGRKRTSNEMSQDSQNATVNEPESELQPPSKRRTTQIRRSNSITIVDPVDHLPLPEPAVSHDRVPSPETKKTKRTTKKGRSSKALKSATARASKTSTRAYIPEESELNAAIDAEPDVNMTTAQTDEVIAIDEPAEKPSSKSGKRSTIASRAPVRESVVTKSLKDNEDADRTSDDHHKQPAEVTAEPVLKMTSKRKTASKKSKKEADLDPPSAANEPSLMDQDRDHANSRDNQSHGSFISVEIPVKALEEHKPETDDVPSESAPRHGKKKAAASKGKKKASKVKPQSLVAASDEPENEPENDPEIHQSDNHIEPAFNEAEEPVDQQVVTSQSGAPPKTTERYSDIAQQEHRAQSLLAALAEENGGKDVERPSAAPVPTAQPIQIQEGTPSPSPQSSDAENQPPSSRPSASRPPLISPSKTQTTRIPLAASTPKQSPYRRQEQSAYLTSSKIWTPIDLEFILNSKPDDKENFGTFGSADRVKDLLTSPEKGMTVEEWILWQAKNGEERLKRECERLVNLFEQEGGRAMRAVEGIECIE